MREVYACSWVLNTGQEGMDQAFGSGVDTDTALVGPETGDEPTPAQRSAAAARTLAAARVRQNDRQRTAPYRNAIVRRLNRRNLGECLGALNSKRQLRIDKTPVGSLAMIPLLFEAVRSTFQRGIREGRAEPN